MFQLGSVLISVFTSYNLKNFLLTTLFRMRPRYAFDEKVSSLESAPRSHIDKKKELKPVLLRSETGKQLIDEANTRGSSYTKESLYQKFFQ